MASHDNRWCSHNYRGFSSGIQLGIPLTRNLAQGVEYLTSGRRSRELVLLPWSRRNCFFQSAGISVSGLVTRAAETSSLRRNSDSQLEFHLRTLSDGGHHPAAECPIIYFPQRDGRFSLFSSSITSSRLVLSLGQHFFRGSHFIIWDWRSARVLFVCQYLG